MAKIIIFKLLKEEKSLHGSANLVSQISYSEMMAVGAETVEWDWIEVAERTEYVCDMQVLPFPYLMNIHAVM